MTLQTLRVENLKAVLQFFSQQLVRISQPRPGLQIKKINVDAKKQGKKANFDFRRMECCLENACLESNCMLQNILLYGGTINANKP